MSPAIMERYLDAAEKISRLAVGDTHAPVLVNRYRLSAEQWQGARLDDLPWGTRGGLSVKSNFPADGEYVISVQLATPPAQPHQIEISINGERMQLVTVGTQTPRHEGAAGHRNREPAIPSRTGRSSSACRSRRGRGSSASRSSNATRCATSQRFVRACAAAATSPRYRSSRSAGPPHGAKSPGDSRRAGAASSPVIQTTLFAQNGSLLSLTRRAYRRPVTDADIQDLLPFYEQGRADAGVDAGIERALQRLLVSPQFLLPRRARAPSNVAAGATFHISDLELASRLSFFLWSSIPDDTLMNVAAQGQLHTPSVLEREVRRMLRDRRSASLVTNFAEQWLFVRDIEAKQPDGLIFPDFDENAPRGDCAPRRICFSTACCARTGACSNC